MAYRHCRDVYGILWVRRWIWSGKGYAMALDYQNQYAGSCVKQDYTESQMVTCYYKSSGSSSRCTDGICDTSPFCRDSGSPPSLAGQ
mmetsp:Transcript_43899/g.51429  ORF Transcript_43899/g.51429 Transcript_43899/m.51429 type:complete len:87 (-) Transcript_43899:1118-1378(-)